MLDNALPQSAKGRYDALDSKGLSKLLTYIAQEHPEDMSDTLRALTDVARDTIYYRGRDASLGLADLVMPPDLQAYRDSVRQEVSQIMEGTGSAKEKQKQIIALLMKRIGEIPQTILDKLPEDNALAMQVRSGARGNKSQLMQTLFGDVLVVDAQDKPVPIPALHGYGEGVTPLEYWAASNGARKGSVSVQFSTAEGGYFGKQMSNVGHRIVVTSRDCGTTRGIPVDADDEDNIGSVLAADVGPYKAGTIITRDMMGKMGDGKIAVRSLVTCEEGDGVCSKCCGVREKGRLPEIGDPVGIVATRSISEPVTQAGLKAKHSGGVAGSDDKQVSGFKEMNQFVQVPENFLGAATLAGQDGIVTSITKAPAGGYNVKVDDKDYYVPVGRNVVVKQGEQVYAGDMLSDGTPNPAELTHYKGVGEGRRYFVEKYRELLKKNGAAVHRRNIEALARGFINRIEVDDPDGYDGYIMGDILPYDSFAHDYRPRPGSLRATPAEAKGMYLERPALHYTIGTRLTPAVINDLKNAKVTDVIVNQNKPVFDAKVIRARSMLSSDPDWITRLAGENLKKNMLESARMGASSTPKGTSYFPAMANPVEIDKYLGGRPRHTDTDFTEI